MWDTSVLAISNSGWGVSIYITTWSTSVALPFAKLTFFIFYIQLFKPFRWLLISCYIGIAFTICAYLSFFIAQVALCTPHPGESWLQMYADPREFANLDYLAIPVAATSFAIDIYVLVLPIVGVSKLKMSRRRRVGVLLIFMTGFVACVFSFLTMYFKITVNENKSDVTWNDVSVVLFSLVELCVGISCSCMPSLAKFTGHHFPEFSLVDSLMSLKIFSFATRYATTSSNTGVSSAARKRPFNKVSTGESDENLRTNEHALETWKTNIGNVNPTETIIENGSIVELEAAHAIHIQQAWNSTSQ